MFIFSGCIQKIAMGSISGLLDNGFEVLNEEQDLGLAEASIGSDLKLLESVLRSDPDNEHLLLMACEGYSSYSLGFVEDDSASRARFFYNRGRDFGFRILRHRSAFEHLDQMNTEQMTAALTTLSKDDVPAVFWTAVGWGSAIRLSLTDPEALADLPKVEAMMRFVDRTDSTYFYGGSKFFLGTLEGSRSPMLGGDTTGSRRNFQSAIALSGGKYLMTYVYFASTYAFQTQNRELFEQCLTIIDTTSLDVLPQARLSNAIAKRKAILLRSKVDDLF
jgi:hypothetical protein